jgi:hypothetical protein
MRFGLSAMSRCLGAGLQGSGDNLSGTHRRMSPAWKSRRKLIIRESRRNPSASTCCLLFMTVNEEQNALRLRFRGDA